MNGLVEVLAAHHGCHMVAIRRGRVTWSCGLSTAQRPTVSAKHHDAHVAAAILAHLRAVAADEGVRRSVAFALHDRTCGDRRCDPMVMGRQFNDTDTALAAFLGALSDEHAENVPECQPGAERGTEAHSETREGA